MSKKEELLRKAEEFNRQSAERRPPDKPYDGRGMVSRMPLGCLIILVILLAIVIYFFSRFVGGVH